MLQKILIENYKSIKKVEIEISNINILIGSNGAGKSNFISFFKLLNSLIKEKLQYHIAEESGANNVFHHGLKNSEYLVGEVSFRNDRHLNEYLFQLKPNSEGGVFFSSEFPRYISEQHNQTYKYSNFASGNSETNLKNDSRTSIKFLRERLNELRVYHFHDTSKTALVKQSYNIHDNEILHEDARNLASFLFKLSLNEPKTLEKIEKTIRLVAPFFENFILKPSVFNEEEIRLGWKEKNSDMLFNASHLSDGTLRMICLVTLFLQPNPPQIIILDEPELGLHPFALTVLSDLIKKVASKEIQVIISTQSVSLMDKFNIEDIIIVEKKEKESTFKRLQIDELKEWINEYSVSDLWEMNLLGGRP